MNAWTVTHESSHRGSGKVYRRADLGLAVSKTYILGLDGDGWVFQFTSRVTGVTETHSGFRTMAAAKAAAVKYATSPVGTAL